jgi:hypothetical protein
MKKSIFVSFVLGMWLVAPAAAENCDKGSMMDIRRCMARSINELNKAIDMKVFDVCAAKVAKGGSQGPAAVDERLICRIERLSKILASVD